MPCCVRSRKRRPNGAFDGTRRLALFFPARVSGGAPVNFDVRRQAPAGVESPDHLGDGSVKLDIECEREDDGRWLAEVPQLPGVLAYGASRDEAMARAQVLAFRVLADRLEHGESAPQSISISVAA